MIAIGSRQSLFSLSLFGGGETVALFAEYGKMRLARNIPPFCSVILRCLCSDNTDFFNKCTEMCSFFINHQYLAANVDCTMHKAFSIDHATALTLKTRANNIQILFTINFYPIDNSIKPIVYCNFNLLNSDSSTSNIFSQEIP